MLLQHKVLTVSIAAYNVEKYIEECLAPFTQAGVYERCEVIVIDDGGTDHTKEIAERFARMYPETFQVIHKANGGWGSTVNTGIRLAHGRYFKQLDGDDYFDSETLNSFLDALEKAETDIVLSPYVTFVSDTKEIIEQSKPAEYFGAELNKEYEICTLDPKYMAMHQCTFKTSLLQNGMDPLLEHAFYTDVEYTIKAFCASSTVLFVPMTVYWYRVGRDGQSMSTESMRKHYKEHEAVVFRIADFLRDKENAPGYAIASNRLVIMLGWQYLFYSKLSAPLQHFQEVKAFDRKLKNMYPEFYKRCGKGAKLLRMTHFLAYFPICWYEARH